MEKHFILTLGRSGSNALVDIINQHPQALNYGELLGEWNEIHKWRNRFRLWRGDETAYLGALLSNGIPLLVINALRSLKKRKAGKSNEVQRSRDLRTIGAKDFATFFNNTDLRTYFQERPDLKVIGLYRENIIARFISWQLLDQTGTVKKAVTDKSNAAQITLDTSTILANITHVANEADLLQNMLSELPEEQVLWIKYEDFFFDPDQLETTIQSIFAFLGLPPASANIRARKINTARLRKTIVNYDACLEALIGSKFEHEFRAAG